VLTNVSKPSRSQKGVCNRMQERICIGMPK